MMREGQADLTCDSLNFLFDYTTSRLWMPLPLDAIMLMPKQLKMKPENLHITSVEHSGGRDRNVLAPEERDPRDGALLVRTTR
jgi:hypothetical protein